MPEAYSTVVGQFSSSGGQIQLRAGNVRAVEPAADVRGAERGNLYMLLEVTGSGGGHAALFRQVLNAAQTAYYEMGDSLETALRQAVRSAHHALVKANEALPEANWRAGLTLAAVLDNTLAIIQAGPSLAMLSHPKTVEQFPIMPGPAGPALGGPERPDPQLVLTTIEPGDILLLASSEWLTRTSAEALAVTTALPGVPQAIEYLGRLADKAELSALVVGFYTAQAQPAAPPAPASPEPRAAMADRVAPPQAAADTTPPTEQGQPGSLRSILERPKAPSGTPPTPPPAAPSAAQPAAPSPGRPSASQPQRAAAPTPRSDRNPMWLLLALIVVPILVAALVLTMLWLRTRAAERQFEETLAGATTAITEAATLPDEATARLRLNSALAFLDKAKAMRPDDARVVRLQARYDDVLAQVDRVTPLYGVTMLWQFRESGRDPRRIAIGGDSIFVLDRGRQELNRFVLGPRSESALPADPAVILRKGQQVGDAVVSDLLDVAWVDAVASQRSRLLAMDTTGGLVGFDVTWGAERVVLSGRETWGLAQYVATYIGNLYVVDVKANQIWRYRPTAKGYENPPEKYFAANTKVDLAGVQDIAIDRNIWLLFADGRLLKFYMGGQEPFELRGLPDPLGNPTAIAAPIDQDQLYVADAARGRILEFNKEGVFLRQFRPSPSDMLRGIRHMVLDSTGSRFYILTADRLYKADLPKPPAAPTPTPTPTPTPAPGR